MRDEKITSVRLPETLKTIENYSFAECKALKELRITANVKQLEKNCFYKTSNLQRIDITGECKVPDGDNPFAECSARIMYYNP